ncbi:MAG: SAM-dependent methyltransferase, partial [Rhizobiaceae bacterium]|nr:SAM-dependent methyltransferase [Rhizobiaceae bacterium]
VAPGGRLHVVDFGQQERLPRPAHRLLSAWLAKFHVAPRADLPAVFEREAARIHARSVFRPIKRGYAWLLTAERPAETR